MKVVAYRTPSAEPGVQAQGVGRRPERSFAEVLGGPVRGPAGETQAAAPQPGKAASTAPPSARGPAASPNARDRGRRASFDAAPPASRTDGGQAVSAAAATPAVTAAVAGPSGQPPVRSQGYQFDELGMFGETGVVGARLTPLAAGGELASAAAAASGASEMIEAALAGVGTAGEAATTGPAAGQAGASTAFGQATGTPGLRFATDVAPPVLAATVLAATGGVTPAEAAEDGETLPAARRRSAEPPSFADDPQPASVVLHDDGEGVSLAAAAAPLSVAEQGRVWRSVKDYAAELGLELRSFHLNGWAAGPHTPRSTQDGG